MNLFHTFAKTTMLAALAAASSLACSGSGAAGDTSLGTDVPPRSTEYPTTSTDLAPGQSGQPSAVGLKCPAVYNCLIAGSSKMTSVNLVPSAGGCSDGKDIMFETGGTINSEGEPAGTWTVNGNGFVAVLGSTPPTTIVCVPADTTDTPQGPPKDTGTK